MSVAPAPLLAPSSGRYWPAGLALGVLLLLAASAPTPLRRLLMVGAPRSASSPSWALSTAPRATRARSAGSLIPAASPPSGLRPPIPGRLHTRPAAGPLEMGPGDVPLLALMSLAAAAAALPLASRARGEAAQPPEEDSPLTASPLTTDVAPVPDLAANQESAAGDFYFDFCVDCARALDKPPPSKTDESWRAPADRYRDCGEDSFFCSPSVLAVADGVGGWQQLGVDPGLFANALMKHAQTAMRQGVRDPQALMGSAYIQTLAEVDRGSATCLIAALDPFGRLVSANLGDCGLRVVRGDRCVHATKEMQVGFNQPLQLTTDANVARYMNPAVSQVQEFQTQPGDLVILASDGLLDNLAIPDILQVVQSHGAAPGASLAEALKARALEVAQSRTADSPFARSARRAGYRYAGGKPDDITVVVGRVAQRS